jgi:hypothetical protein
LGRDKIGLVFTKLWDYVNGKNPLGKKASTSVTGTVTATEVNILVHFYLSVF